MRARRAGGRLYIRDDVERVWLWCIDGQQPTRSVLGATIAIVGALVIVGLADSQRRLRELFRRGRISLVIALAFLSASLAVSDLVGRVSQSRFVEVFREGLLIVGAPARGVLYDWWSIRAEVRLFERLSTMPFQNRVQRDCV